LHPGNAEDNGKVDPTIIKKVDKREVFFSIHWSVLKKADKYDISASVPSIGGIYELYYMDEKKKLNLMFMDWVWYGGLRSRLRRLTDVTLIYTPEHKKILENYTCYYRYSLSNSSNDMMDIIFFFGKSHFPNRDFEHSGRFDTIYVTEHSPQKLITL